MKITKVQARRHRGDTTQSYLAEIVVVEVSTDADIVGTGFANAPPRVGALFQELIENVLASKVLGADPRLTTDLWEKMYREAIPRRGGEGIVRVCIAAIDMALWDIKGKALGVPVARLLGGHRDLIPTYANCAHHLPPDELAERAASYVARGHRALKIRGTRSYVTPAEATERVRRGPRGDRAGHPVDGRRERKLGRGYGDSATQDMGTLRRLLAGGAGAAGGHSGLCPRPRPRRRHLYRGRRTTRRSARIQSADRTGARRYRPTERADNGRALRIGFAFTPSPPQAACPYRRGIYSPSTSILPPGYPT